MRHYRNNYKFNGYLTVTSHNTKLLRIHFSLLIQTHLHCDYYFRKSDCSCTNQLLLSSHINKKSAFCHLSDYNDCALARLVMFVLFAFVNHSFTV